MHEKIKARGEYFCRVNGGAWERIGNMITDEGLSHILNVAFGSEAKPQCSGISQTGMSVLERSRLAKSRRASARSSCMVRPKTVL